MRNRVIGLYKKGEIDARMVSALIGYDPANSEGPTQPPVICLAAGKAAPELGKGQKRPHEECQSADDAELNATLAEVKRVKAATWTNGVCGLAVRQGLLRGFDCQEEAALKQKLRRVMQPRKDGSYLVPEWLVEEWKKGDHLRMAREYEAMGFNKAGC